MATQNKAQFLSEIHGLLKSRYAPEPSQPRLTILEAVVYGICHEGTTREQANQALSRFKDEFFDWNEVRVSTLEEIQEVLAGLPDAADRARRIRRFLRQLFEKTYGFSLDPLLKKPLKESVRALQDYEALRSDYVLATVISHALGGHAISLDQPMKRALDRLGFSEADADLPTLRATLERGIPKNRGHEFMDVMEDLTHDVCVEEHPICGRCALQTLCPFGKDRGHQMTSVAKSPTRRAPKAAAEPKDNGSAGESPVLKRSKTPRPK